MTSLLHDDELADLTLLAVRADGTVKFELSRFGGRKLDSGSAT